MIDISTKFLGSMVGSALGDAIGELAFSAPERNDLCTRINDNQKLKYTDDTAMSIGLAEALTEKGDLDQQSLGKIFDSNFRKEPWRGYASGPPAIFSLAKRYNISYAEAAQSLFNGTGSLGNGAAMRIAPLGLVFHDLFAQGLYEKVRISAAVTHAHPVGIDGAAIQARAVAFAVNLDRETPSSNKKFIEELAKFARTPQMKEKMRLLSELASSRSPPDFAAHQLGQTVAAHESVPFALFTFLSYPVSFEDCLFCAVLHGGDRDTLGAMACAISGAYGGIDSIPQVWKKKLENESYIETLALKLSRIASH